MIWTFAQPFALRAIVSFCISSFTNSCRLYRHAFQQCWEILYVWHVGGDGALTADLQDEAQHAARFTT